MNLKFKYITFLNLFHIEALNAIKSRKNSLYKASKKRYFVKISHRKNGVHIPNCQDVFRVLCHADF